MSTDKTSFYNVEQPLVWKGRKYVLIYNTVSGELRLISDELWGHLSSGQYSHVPETVLEDVKQANIIVPLQKSETRSVLDENQNFIKNNQHFYMPIQPTASCPFGCGYCGQEHSSKAWIL